MLAALSTIALPLFAPPTLLVRWPAALASALNTGKSDAPTTRTCASACCTRSVAIARSGLPASASATSDSSSGEPNAVHHVGDTTAASAGVASFHVPATGTSGRSCGLVIAQPDSEPTSTSAMDRCTHLFMSSLRGQRHDRVERRRLASREIAEDQSRQECAGKRQHDGAGGDLHRRPQHADHERARESAAHADEAAEPGHRDRLREELLPDVANPRDRRHAHADLPLPLG